ncbi:hypothetical protein IscW_ISCW008487 [Ixodes scapularis]|uniref:Uncharacterized protein n=1 Tax=Ixodes scapularis TaxID=6945 RepID=B7PT91_IXOSC|nr:hypothetical protein IscW_ISCW008487 [Ixodes scapularis]|eukprot:XP_002404031.1 hypothetical protein IscW_ISCW008487 [Ixodes scapularis]
MRSSAAKSSGRRSGVAVTTSSAGPRPLRTSVTGPVVRRKLSDNLKPFPVRGACHDSLDRLMGGVIDGVASVASLAHC